LDSQQPILIGVAQLSDRDVTLETAMNPVEMLERIAREAAESAGGRPDLLTSIDTIALAEIFGWRASNPPQLLAEAIGANPKNLISSHLGGETALALTNRIAEKIALGESELGFVGGCNNLRTLTLAQRAGVRPDWPTGDESSPDIVGTATSGINEAEKAVGLEMPIQVYPIFENALRAARGQSLSEHREAMGRLFQPFTGLAAKNPQAWFPTERSADELTRVTEANRMICFPYPKYLNAVMATDQAAGALIASQAMARKLGIPEEKWIYWRGGAYEVEEPWFLSDRNSYAESPAMRSCHTTALANAGLSLDEIDLIDFYSCFPSAVSMACEMLGLSQDDPRGFTLTGGLPYAGGPGNSYSFHSLATAVTNLREKCGEHAMLTGNGWYLTKHSATILSRQPIPGDFEPSATATSDTTRSRWKTPATEVVSEANGPAEVETYTIVHDREGAPSRGIIIGRLRESNRRFLANTPADPQLLADLEKIELIGTQGNVQHESGRNVYRPA
jgi:acetyl-CoA C-acetyltransferase